LSMRLHGDIDDRSDSQNSFAREESHKGKQRRLRGLVRTQW
jgi:hypothetical protein